MSSAQAVTESARVRAMTGADLDAVLAVERTVYAFPWSLGNFSDSLAAGYDAWVFESGERSGQAGSPALLGYAVAMWSPEALHLLNLSVAGPLQRRGLGREFLRWLLANARARGGEAMLLEVRPSNHAALALYRSEGFEVIGRRPGYYPAPGGLREDGWVLRRMFADE